MSEELPKGRRYVFTIKDKQGNILESTLSHWYEEEIFAEVKPIYRNEKGELILE